MTYGADYPVNMMQYSDDALMVLLSELVTSQTVGKKNVYNVGCAFDTEASSFRDENDNKVGLCYIWMFGIKDTVVYGRTLGQFVALINSLNVYLKGKDSRLFCYVHNLTYDFSFIKRLFKWTDVFIKASREPLYARIGNIEFRDSLVLSGNQSLARIGEKVLRVKLKKAVGDLNYNLIRTPETPMTQQEFHYCEMDIRVLVEYIQEKIEDDGDILKIPYTNTGYVRRYVRNECFRHRGRYMDLIDGLTMTPDCYLQMEKAFGGGAVGPNIKYADQIIEGVQSRDIKSSYPYVMVAEYYPMGYFEPVQNKEANKNLEKLVTSYCCCFRLEIFNMFPRTDYCFPISESKCNEIIGAQTASGRVISAAYVSINCTELDYETYKRFYNFEEAEQIRVSYMRIAPRGYLPVEIVRSILKFFFDKTTLDGVPGKEAEYMIAKNMLNACYGMMVEKVVRVPYAYGDDFEKGEKDYVKQVCEYNDKRNRFLYYPWGVWVTAHARSRLYDAIYNIGDDWRYCDTDCVKYVGNHDDYFERVNAEARAKLEEVSKRYNISMSQVVPAASKYSKTPGKKMYLGVWELEYVAPRFKTIGAKRYLVEHKDGSLALTVAGTNKAGTLRYMVEQSIYKMADREEVDYSNFETACYALYEKNGWEVKEGMPAVKMAYKLLVTSTDAFDMFTDGLIIPPEYAKRLVMTYIDTPRFGYITDYKGVRRWYSVDSGVNAENASYSFSITDQMKDAIDWLMHDAHYEETTL